MPSGGSFMFFFNESISITNKTKYTTHSTRKPVRTLDANKSPYNPKLKQIPIQTPNEPSANNQPTKTIISNYTTLQPITKHAN
jgi:hypothetical protein